MKKSIDKKNILKYAILAYFMVSPIFDTVFLYSHVTSAIRVGLLLIFAFATFVLYEDSRKKAGWLLVFYAIVGLYSGISYVHSRGFFTYLPDLEYSLLGEAMTLAKLSMPFTILFILKYQKIVKKEFWAVIIFWVIAISGSVVVCNLCGYSLSSYTNEFTSYNIFSWGQGLSVNDIATKAFFSYANQVSIVSLVLLPLVFYGGRCSAKKGIFFDGLLFVVSLAMLMLGTRLSTYGGLLVLISLLVFTVGYSFVYRKEYWKSLLVPLGVTVLWVVILPIAPCNSRMQEIENAKGGAGYVDSSAAASEEVDVDMTSGDLDEDLQYIEANINHAIVGRQFYIDFYPYKYDMSFWREFVEYQKENYVDYRDLEMRIANRLFEVDGRFTDVLFGISNSRMQSVTNVERDFVLQYFSFGLAGCAIVFSFYGYVLFAAAKKAWMTRGFWDMMIFGCALLFLVGSYMTGNSINFLATIVPFAFVVCVRADTAERQIYRQEGHRFYYNSK